MTKTYTIPFYTLSVNEKEMTYTLTERSSQETITRPISGICNGKYAMFIGDKENSNLEVVIEKSKGTFYVANEGKRIPTADLFLDDSEEAPF